MSATSATLAGSTNITKCLICNKQVSMDEFKAMKFGGHQSLEFIRRPGEPAVLELRHCTCGTTLSVGFNEDGTLNNTPLEM